MPTLKPHGTADNKLPDNSNAKPQRSKYPLRGKPQIRKASEPLQLDREDLRLVDQIQLKLQRGDLVRDGARNLGVAVELHGVDSAALRLGAQSPTYPNISDSGT